MPAAAMTWAISPPITPAPTTAALNTNIVRGSLLEVGGAPSYSAQLGGRRALAREAGEGALQRRRHGPADDKGIDERCQRVAFLQGVVEAQRHVHGIASRREAE